jgi:hypothetical protein
MYIILYYTGTTGIPASLYFQIRTCKIFFLVSSQKNSK